MKHIEKELHENVAVLKFNRDVTNAISLELINELSGCVENCVHDKSVAGIVLTSANDKFFSIGFDIPGLIDLNTKEFNEFYTAFNRLCIQIYSVPKPIVAAITGHAVAGGCIIALCCDYRFIAEGKKLMGLNEIKLGVPLPFPADRILRQIVDDSAARRILDTGDFFPPEDTLTMGLVDEIMPLEDVVNRAIEKIKSIANCSLDAFTVIKRNRTGKVEAEIKEGLKRKEKIFVEMWYSPETRGKLKQALEKF